MTSEHFYWNGQKTAVFLYVKNVELSIDCGMLEPCRVFWICFWKNSDAGRKFEQIYWTAQNFYPLSVRKSLNLSGFLFIII